jgi:chromosome partitioning protein
MTRIIAVANQKGGTGKTTTAVNVAAGLARSLRNGKVLLIDADPQANATAVFLGIPFAAGPRQPGVATIYEVISGDASLESALRTVTLPPGPGSATAVSLDILPAHLDLAAAELDLVTVFERERRLREVLQPILSHYAYMVIDCPPSLGLLTINALMAATEVLVPVEPGLFPLIGLSLLRKTIDMVARANSSLHVMGVVPSMVDRTALARDTQSELGDTYGDLLLPPIPRRVAIGEAHAAGQDIFAYDTRSDSAEAYAALVQEIINRG